jgi:hypothetical protein
MSRDPVTGRFVRGFANVRVGERFVRLIALEASEQARNRRPSAYAGSRTDPVTGRFLPKAVA